MDEQHTQRHEDAEFHHHHSHGPNAHHAHGHHLLQIEGLSVGFTMYARTGSFSSERAFSPVLRDLNLSVHAGEILALVGASGSGKTVLADAVMGIYEPNARVEGTIYFDGELQTPSTLAAHRGRDIAFVPQGISALDPLMTIGRQVGGDAARRREVLGRYGLGEEVDKLYPHQLSGGMARRALLACALVRDPKLIIADEPTPGLDLELAVCAMDDFRAFADAGGGVLLITHDIELALRAADRIAVFLDGAVVEETAVESFADPDLLQHPFSKALWHALPEHDFVAEKGDAS